MYDGGQSPCTVKVVHVCALGGRASEGHVGNVVM